MKGYRTKKIALPGGRVIEIVYFSEPDGEGTPEARSELEAVTAEVTAAAAAVDEEEATGGIRAGALHVCPTCDSDLVYPVAWDERGEEHWRIVRRCPNCEWLHEGEFHQGAVELFDDVLNDGTETLLLTLRTFARSNMAEDVERLIDAIHRDLIEPIDF